MYCVPGSTVPDLPDLPDIAKPVRQKNMNQYVVVFILMFSFVGICKGNKLTNQHSEKPQQASESKFDAESMVKKIMESEYVKNLAPLEEFVSGYKVIGSKAGNSGFILILSDDRWAAAYRKADTIGSSFGTGEPTKEINGYISSDKFGDASQPLSEDVIYANEYVDIEHEVQKSHGGIISGLAYGFNTFSFAFEGGRELDFKLVNDLNGVPAVRVFWEQW